MSDFFDNEATRWIIGIVVTILLGGIGIVVPYFINRKRKRLWYQTSIYPLVRETLDERIAILFDGEAVPNVYVSIIDLRYKGTEPIMEDDYRTPITFDFGATQILDAEVFETKPDGISGCVSVKDKNRVVFEPIALNDENRIAARVLLTSRNTPRVRGHIIGVKEFQNEDQLSSLRSIVGLVAAPLAAFLISALALAYIAVAYGLKPSVLWVSKSAPVWLNLVQFVAFLVALGLLVRVAWRLINDIRSRGQRF